MSGSKQRPLGSLCLRCGVEPARANARHPHLATSWCVFCQRYKTTAGPKRKQRPLGSLCLHGCGRPARPSKLHPHLATNWCSDHCKAKHDWDAARAERLTLANDLRIMLGMDARRKNSQFSLPELRMMRVRVRRLLPDDVRIARGSGQLRGPYANRGRRQTHQRRAS